MIARKVAARLKPNSLREFTNLMEHEIPSLVNYPTSAQERRVTMKSVGLLVLGGVCLLAGCGGGSMGGSPNVTLSATSLTFGSEPVGTPSATQTITLGNSGTGTLSNVIIGGTGPYFEETSTCGSTLASGANCVISVTFVPGTTGDLTGTVSVTDNAQDSPQNVALSGTGTSGAHGGTLDGYCLSPDPTRPAACRLTFEPSSCPPGQAAKSPGYTQCPNGIPIYVDSAAGCAHYRGAYTGECTVIP